MARRAARAPLTARVRYFAWQRGLAIFDDSGLTHCSNARSVQKGTDSAAPLAYPGSTGSKEGNCMDQPILSSSPVQYQMGHPNAPLTHEAQTSGVSWPAVIGGAVVTAALSLSLIALGTGLGLSSVSPWSNVGASASAIGTAAIVWLILMQVVSSSMGGYLAGRLRTKWANIHTDELTTCMR